MIPTAILGGFLLGLLVRWWAVPAIGVVWATAMVVSVHAAPLPAAALGAANACVGTSFAVILRRISAASAPRP